MTKPDREVNYGFLELRVIGLIYGAGRPVIVREIFEALLTEREISYMTIMTVMKNLVIKEALEVDTSDFKHRYWPTIPRQEFVRARLADLVVDFYSGEVEDFIEDIRDIELPDRPIRDFAVEEPRPMTPPPPPGFNRDGTPKKKRGRPIGSKNRPKDGVGGTLPNSRSRPDSLDKIIPAYFGAVTLENFTYGGRTFPVTDLYVSPKLLRGFICKEGCGACCGRYTIDFLPGEPLPEKAVERQVIFNEKEITIFSDLQNDSDSLFCRHVSSETGRCAIHGQHALGCDFELIRIAHKKKLYRYEMSTCLYTRGWNMRRPTGGRGNRCEMLLPTTEAAIDIKRKLFRLKDWTDHFGIETRLPTIIEWIDANIKRPEWAQPLVFRIGQDTLF